MKKSGESKKSSEATFSNQGAQRIWVNLNKFIQTKEFNQIVKTTRLLFSVDILPIPEHIPEETFVYIPKEYKERNNIKKPLEFAKYFNQKVREEFPLANSPTLITLQFYLFHDKLIPDFLKNDWSKEFEKNNLCQIIDLPEMIEELPPDVFLESMKNTAKNYPIAILINPAAKQTVIIDFVQKNRDYIEFLLNKYPTPKNLPRENTKSEDLAKRNEIVYQYRDYPREKIKSILDKEMPDNTVTLRQITDITAYLRKKFGE